MWRLRSFALTIAVLAIGGCNRPISDRAELKAIRSEAMWLMETYPATRSHIYTSVAKQGWPAAIARLQPESVTVHTWGVDIITKPYFDGGSGYEIPRKKADLPMPPACYSELSHGVFWHGSC